MNNETKCFLLLCFSSKYATYAPFFILGKLSLEKAPLNKPRFDTKIISILDVA